MSQNGTARASVYLLFDKRNAKVGMQYIRYIIKFGGIEKIISTGSSLSDKEAEFLRGNKNGLSRQVKSAEKILLWNFVYGQTYQHPDTGEVKDGLLQRALNVIDSLGDQFTFDLFKQGLKNYNRRTFPTRVIEETQQTVNVFDYMQVKSDRLKGLEQFGTSSLYCDSKNSLRRFVGREHLAWAEIDADFLARYELFMKKQGKTPKTADKSPGPASQTTIGIYLRCLRSCFNDAIEDELVSEKNYPFKKKKYVIPGGVNVKKDMPPSDVEKIIGYECSTETEARSRDFWVLSYLCNGANFADLLRLKGTDFDQDGFTFTRRKTSRTKKSSTQLIKVFLDDLGYQIVNRWRKNENETSGLVFPFLSGMNEEEKHKATKQFIRTTNLYMKKIASSLGITTNLTTYVARHSFGTALISSGVPIMMVSGMLGHSSVVTTQNYFGGFKDDQIKGAMSALRKKSSGEDNLSI